MKPSIETTESNLVAAFEKWDTDYLENPDEYDEITNPKSGAERQAKHLIKLLTEKK